MHVIHRVKIIAETTSKNKLFHKSTYSQSNVRNDIHAIDLFHQKNFGFVMVLGVIGRPQLHKMG